MNDIAESVARMAKIGGCWSPSFSPDGSQIAFISNLNGIPQVWTVASSGGWPRLVTSLDDQVGAVMWSPDGEWLAFTIAPGGGLNSQIYLIRPNGTDMHRLTDGGQTNNWLNLWSHDGKMVAVASNRRTKDALDAYVIDVITSEHHLIAENRGVGVTNDISHNNRLAVVWRMVNRGDNDLYLINRETGVETLLTAHQGPTTFGSSKFSPDDSTLYLNGNFEREMTGLFRIRLDSDDQPGKLELIAGRDNADLYEFEIAPDGKTIAVLWNVGGQSELEFLDTQTLSLSPASPLPAELAGDLHFSQDGRKLVMRLSGAAAPRDLWIYDMETQRYQQITFSQHAGVDLTTLVRPELATFNAHDGLKLSGWLYLPHDFQAPGAVVLSFHGGPEGQETPNFNPTYQALLAQGIAVFAPNVRGSTGFGKTFVNLDNGALRVNAVRDIESCANYVIERGIGAPGQLGIMGGSYGGYMTMAGVTEFPDLFAAGANLYGIVNFKTFFEHTEGWMAAISKIEYGDPDTEGDMLNSLSPIFKLDRVKAAVLVLHGANDTNVPVIEAEQVVDHLRINGVEVEYVLFPDEGHGFLKEANRIRATTALVSWFMRYLRPHTNNYNN